METNLAYVAGLFDGEGCVDIYNATTSKASKSPSFLLRVVITQKDGSIMTWLEKNFGGYVRMDRRKDNWIHRWDIRSKAAYEFLVMIQPYVKIKSEQVKLALEFHKVKGNYLDSLKGHQGFRKLTKQEIGERVMIKNKLKKAKRTYGFYMKTMDVGAPTTTKREDALMSDVIV